MSYNDEAGTDSKFDRNIKAVQRLGIPYSIYLYGYAACNNAAEKEAKFVTEMMKKYNIPSNTFIWYDAEENRSRNIYNQLCAVSMIENAKLDCSPVNYKISKIARFFNINLTVANKLMTKQELYKKLANNDINLCVSTVDENSMIPYESLELGTLCLVGNSFKAFEGSSLQDYLAVKNADDILEIKEKTLNALENREKILEEYKLWREKNKQDALKNLKEVLE